MQDIETPATHHEAVYKHPPQETKEIEKHWVNRKHPASSSCALTALRLGLRLGQ